MVFTSPAYDGAMVSPWALGQQMFMWTYVLGADNYVLAIATLSAVVIYSAAPSSSAYAFVPAAYFARGASLYAAVFARSGDYIVGDGMVKFTVSP